jgi:hypothetical protein
MIAILFGGKEEHYLKNLMCKLPSSCKVNFLMKSLIYKLPSFVKA